MKSMQARLDFEDVVSKPINLVSRVSVERALDMSNRFFDTINCEHQKIAVLKRGEKTIASSIPRQSCNTGAFCRYGWMNKHFHAAIERGQNNHAVFLSGGNQTILRMRGYACHKLAVGAP